MERSRIQKENPSAAWRRAETVQTLWWFQRKSSPAGQTLLKSTQLWDSRPAGGRAERPDLEEAEFSHKGGRSAAAGTKHHRQRAEDAKAASPAAAAELEDICGQLRKNRKKRPPRQSFKDGGKEHRRKKKKRNSCFIKMVQRLQLSTGRFSLEKSSFFFCLFLKKGIHCFSVLTDLPSPPELNKFHKSSTFLDKSLQSNLTLYSVVINVEAHPFKV